jgi:hypothetical protein
MKRFDVMSIAHLQEKSTEITREQEIEEIRMSLGKVHRSISNGCRIVRLVLMGKSKRRNKVENVHDEIKEISFFRSKLQSAFSNMLQFRYRPYEWWLGPLLRPTSQALADVLVPTRFMTGLSVMLLTTTALINGPSPSTDASSYGLQHTHPQYTIL